MSEENLDWNKHHLKIFFTGATGFIGAHTAMEFLRAGHQLRLLVRDKQAAHSWFRQRGFEVNDIVEGDMCDKTLIQNNLHGCDAVFHGAAMVSLHPKHKRQVYQSNVASIDAVIGSALEAGIKNIVYVSSLGALFQQGITEINEQTTCGNPKEAYSLSKRDCDERVNQYVKQYDTQVAIQRSYPSGVFGPDDPKLNESNHSLITFVSTMTPVTSTGIQCVDVRDVAKAHLFMLENPTVDGRYIIAGHYYPWKELHALFEKITGNTISSPHISGALFRVIGKLVDFIKLVYPLDTPIGSEAMEIVTQWVPANSQKYLTLSGAHFRSGEQTFSDTLRWLVDAGHLDKKFAGLAYSEFEN